MEKKERKGEKKKRKGEKKKGEERGREREFKAHTKLKFLFHSAPNQITCTHYDQLSCDVDDNLLLTNLT